MSNSESKPTVAEVIAIEDDVAMLESVEKLLPRDDERAAAARHMVETLTSMQLYQSTNGIGQVLDVSYIADELDCVEGWYAALGANRASALVAAVASLFPGGRVPADEAARVDRFMALTENCQYGRPLDDPWYGTGIFQRLDLEFADAVPDVSHAMRAFLRTHADDPVSALVNIEASVANYVPIPRPTEWLEYADNGLDGTAEITAWREQFRKSTNVEKSAPVQDVAVDDRVLTLFDEIDALTTDDWAKVVARRLHVAAERHGLEFTFAAVRAATPRVFTSEGQHRLHAAGADDSHVRASLITRKLPAIAIVDGQRAPLEHLAIRAAIQASDAARWYDDLMASADGRRVLRVMLSPFEGYISLAIPTAV